MPESNTTLWFKAAEVGGALAFVFGSLALAAVLKAVAIFREENRKIDQLVAEYVRCRDYLLGTRRPSATSGWRTAEGDAFREAWRNFNAQVDLIRERYVKRTGPLRASMAALLVATILDAVALLVGARGRESSPLAFLSDVGTGMSWLLPPLTAWFVARAQHRTVRDRTSGNSLVAPWPADGGAPERQFSAYEKFLPVEIHPSEVPAGPEAL